LTEKKKAFQKDAQIAKQFNHPTFTLCPNFAQAPMHLFAIALLLVSAVCAEKPPTITKFVNPIASIKTVPITLYAARIHPVQQDIVYVNKDTKEEHVFSMKETPDSLVHRRRHSETLFEEWDSYVFETNCKTDNKNSLFHNCSITYLPNIGIPKFTQTSLCHLRDTDPEDMIQDHVDYCRNNLPWYLDAPAEERNCKNAVLHQKQKNAILADKLKKSVDASEAAVDFMSNPFMTGYVQGIIEMLDNKVDPELLKKIITEQEIKKQNDQQEQAKKPRTDL